MQFTIRDLLIVTAVVAVGFALLNGSDVTAAVPTLGNAACFVSLITLVLGSIITPLAYCFSTGPKGPFWSVYMQVFSISLTIIFTGFAMSAVALNLYK